MDDEAKGLIYRPNSAEFQAAFDKGGAQWLSADCHRSQYGYPFRVGINMALENRHRAVTLVSVACSGADVTGLFMDHDARERAGEKGGAKVPPQLDQLADLICRGGAKGRTQAASYTLPTYKYGSTSISAQTVAKQWCPPASRKRPNRPRAAVDRRQRHRIWRGRALCGHRKCARSRADRRRSSAAKSASGRMSPTPISPCWTSASRQCATRWSMASASSPSRVLQNAYEPIQFDETGSYCGNQATLGMDVHPSLKVNKVRLGEAANVAGELQKRLACMARSGAGCPSGLATGSGTGFRFITDHIADFSKRGICARDPTRALIDQASMKMPRRSKLTQDWEPYSPAAALPYAHRWRLIHNPNDAFLTANTHREGISPFDILQPAFAALTSGAFHPTAEGTRDRRRPRDAPCARGARQGEEDDRRGAAELAWGADAPHRFGTSIKARLRAATAR